MAPHDPLGDAADRVAAVGDLADRDAVSARIADAGWSCHGDEDAPVQLIDGDAPGGSDAARRDRSAVLAVTSTADAAAARTAFAAGATHWIARTASPEEWATTLAFAGRYARRVRRLPFVAAGRRAEDPAGPVEDAVDAWLGTSGGATGARVMLVALTRFEFVNAAFGRAAGDRLLAAVHARIGRWAQAAFGSAALVARGAGAEFVVAAAGDAASVETLDAALARPFEAGGAAINLGIAIGVAEVEPGAVARALLRRAQDALARARTGDGASTQVAEADAAVPLDRLAADLHHAIEGGEIAVLFQPQVSLATGAITGAEALARWEHPRLGVLGAERLFAAAERAGIATALSDHIQALALAEAAAWPDALARLRLSINVTAADLARGGFVAAFLARVEASGFARGRLTVEIVETGVMENLERAAAILARLRGAGCRIAIDDFGTGYSSLAYLKALPIDYLKIDRSLTRDIAGGPRERVVVRGVIAIARSLGLETIAEGVETEQERALLAEEGCDLYQGYLCAEPLSSMALAVRVAAGTRE